MEMQLKNELEQYRLFGENTPNWLVAILVLTGVLCSVATANLLTDHGLQGIFQKPDAKTPQLVALKEAQSSVMQDNSRLSQELADAKVQLEEQAKENQRWVRERQKMKERLAVGKSKLSSVEQELSRLSQGLAEANTQIEKYIGDYPLREKEKQDLEVKLSSRNTSPEALEMDQRTQSPQSLTNIEQITVEEVPEESGSTPETQESGKINTPAKPVQQDCAPVFSITYEYRSEHPAETSQIKMIEQLGGWLQGHQDARVVVEGHTDSKGTDEYNLLLSYRRARIVSEMLVKEGASEEQLSVQAFGEHSPLEGIPDTSKKNRRVSLRVKGRQGCIEHLSSGDAS